MTAPLPPNEDFRLAVLHRYSVLDTAPEEAFDRLARVAARVFKTPIALVTFLDETRLWFKACFGLNARQTDRNLAFCAYTVLADEVLVVENALEDPRFRDNPLVLGSPEIRFYAGAPLRTREGVALGSLCVIDSVPRKFSAEDSAMLQDLAAMVMDELDLREKSARMAAEIERRDRAEISLYEAHARKAAILEASLDAIVTIDHEGRIIEVNSAAERIFGYSVDEMLGRDMGELMVPQRLRERYREGLRRVLQGDNGRVLGKLVELPAMRANGSEFPIEVAITRIPYNGKPMFTGHIRDITARRRGQRALEESQARYERMAANMPGMVYQFVLHTDGTSRFLFASEACRDVLRIDPLVLVELGASWNRWIFVEDSESLETSILESAKSLEPWHWEGRIELRSGDKAWIKGMARPNRESTGDTVWDGFLFDITGQKKNEEALMQSRDEAERANRAKSEFLSRMSHELRTPLNAILGFGQLLERAQLPGRQGESVAQITKAGRHLLELINEVLDLSRIESGRLSCSPEPVNATERIREALTLIKPFAEEHGIRMLEPIGKEYWAIADQQRLRQVLLNLLSNAVKYNKRGGAVEVRCFEEGRSQVLIAVTDTGIGIAPDKLERAFTPFERLGAEGTEIEGCGIGLALSKRLLEMMGGDLHVKSQLGKGSTFTIQLPAAPASRNPTSSLASLLLPESNYDGNRKCHTVLYVEDNLMNLRLMNRILEERKDVLLHTCERGDEALEAVRAHKPSLILLDLHLPGFTGEQVLRALRLQPETSKTPVVVISADAMSSQVKHLLAAGANEYLTKPIDIGEVWRVLDKYLTNSPAASP